MVTSVACASSVWKHSPSPRTPFQRAIWMARQTGVRQCSAIKQCLAGKVAITAKRRGNLVMEREIVYPLAAPGRCCSECSVSIADCAHICVLYRCQNAANALLARVEVQRCGCRGYR